MKNNISREKQAEIEVGHTKISRFTAVILCTFFFTTILSVPVLQGIYEINNYIQGKDKTLSSSFLTIYSVIYHSFSEFLNNEKDLFSKIRDVNENLLTGIISYEDTLENNSVCRNIMIPPAQSFFTNLFHLGNEKVILGNDGWLFYEPGIRYLTSYVDNEFSHVNRNSSRANTVFIEKKISPADAIIDFKKQLEDRNITLMLLPIPVKPMFYPDKISPRIKKKKGYLQNPMFDSFKTECINNDIIVLDIADLLNKESKFIKTPLFLKSDSHWSPETVSLIAKKIALYIEKNISLTSYHFSSTKLVKKEITNRGDIANMLNMERKGDSGFAETVTINQVILNGNELWYPDTNGEILFLGDSFANIYSHPYMGWGESAGLVEHISYFLNRPLDRIIQNDNGAYATRQSLQYELSRGRDRLKNKKIVIWEFAIRELVTGDWKILDMQLKDSQPGTYYVPDPGEEVIGTGIIHEISSRPIPGTTPYKDHIMAFHIVDMIVDGNINETYNALVYIFSMKDNVLTDAAHYRIGQKITLRLKNWFDVYTEYDSIKRSDIDNEELLFEDPCWCEEIIK